MFKTASLLSLKPVVSLLTFTGLAAFSFSASASDILSGQHHAVSAHVPVSNTYSVGLNKTEIVRLPGPASAVLIGNPAIADVSIHSADTIFVIGRSYGETNLVVLDVNGHTVIDADIQVNNVLPRNGVRIYYGGQERETFNCTPYCAAAPVLGDTPGFIGANSAGAGGGITNTLALGVPNTPASPAPSSASPIPAAANQ